MSGLSSKALGSGGNDVSCGCPNKKGYNGNEIQNKEFSDGSGLEVYDFNARTYDQQIGRFIQIDPLSEEGNQESLTPYHFSFNNPIRFNDLDGKCPCWVFAIPGVKEALAAAASVAAAYVIDKVSKALTPVIKDAVKNAKLPKVGAPVADPNALIPLSAQMAQARLNTESKKFDGQNSTENSSPKEALRNAKDQNGVPRSQQPDKTIKPNTPEGDKAGLDNRNVKQYEYTNSKGEKVVIRQDKPATYPDGGTQPPHFNAGKNPEVPKDLTQHHNYTFDFNKIY